MKKVIAGLLVCAVLIVSNGCSDVIAKRPMAIRMDNNAEVAEADLNPNSPTFQTVPIDEVKEYIAFSTEELTQYLETTTRSLFTYLFTPKELLTTHDYYVVIVKIKVLSDSIQADVQNLTDEYLQRFAIVQARIFIGLKNAKDGRAE